MGQGSNFTSVSQDSVYVRRLVHESRVENWNEPCESGTVLISSSKLELEHEDDSTMIGAAWALVSAMCYAIYLGMLSF